MPVPTWTVRDSAARFKLGPVGVVRDHAARFKLAILQTKVRDSAARFKLQLAPLTLQETSPSGGAISLVAPAAGGNAFANSGGKAVFLVTNTGGASRTLTFFAQNKNNQGLTTNQVVVVPAGTTQLLPIGPFSTSIFNDASRNVQVGYDAITGLSVAVVELP
jgi:hypothetical protein